MRMQRIFISGYFVEEIYPNQQVICAHTHYINIPLDRIISHIVQIVKLTYSLIQNARLTNSLNGKTARRMIMACKI